MGSLYYDVPSYRFNIYNVYYTAYTIYTYLYISNNDYVKRPINLHAWVLFNLKKKDRKLKLNKQLSIGILSSHILLFYIYELMYNFGEYTFG